MFLVICTAKYHIDLGNIPEAMIPDLVREFKVPQEQAITALREMLLSSTYDEIATIFDRLSGIAARFDYGGMKVIHSS